MIYQLRNLHGQKLLERESAEEVGYWLNTRPDLRDCEVWILEEYPGSLQGVMKVCEFMNDGSLNRSYGTTNNDKLINNNTF